MSSVMLIYLSTFSEQDTGVHSHLVEGVTQANLWEEQRMESFLAAAPRKLPVAFAHELDDATMYVG